MAVHEAIADYLKKKDTLDNEEAADWAAADLEYTAAFWRLINVECRTPEEAAEKIRFINENLEPDLLPAETLLKVLQSTSLSSLTTVYNRP